MSDAPNPNTPEGEILQASAIADAILTPRSRGRLRRQAVLLACIIVPFLVLVLLLVLWP